MIEDKESFSSKLLSQLDTFFTKPYITTLLHLISSLEQRAEPYTTANHVFGTRVIQLAVLLQNKNHPKNHHRVEAIQNKEYKEFLTEEQACEYLTNMLSQNLRNEVLAVETKIFAELQAQAQS